MVGEMLSESKRTVRRFWLQLLGAADFDFHIIPLS
jgi:hypothetical protein